LPLSFIACDNGAKHSAYNLVLDVLSKKSPKLHEHLVSEELNLDPELYLSEIFSAMFTQHLSLDDCSRLWDVYVFEGDSALVRAGVALLVENEGRDTRRRGTGAATTGWSGCAVPARPKSSDNDSKGKKREKEKDYRGKGGYWKRTRTRWKKRFDVLIPFVVVKNRTKPTTTTRLLCISLYSKQASHELCYLKL
jgi:hypothetical protein